MFLCSKRWICILNKVVFSTNYNVAKNQVWNEKWRNYGTHIQRARTLLHTSIFVVWLLVPSFSSPTTLSIIWIFGTLDFCPSIVDSWESFPLVTSNTSSFFTKDENSKNCALFLLPPKIDRFDRRSSLLGCKYVEVVVSLILLIQG